ncbi:MAG: YidC/Oxa1 family membrane protein insertase [Anaerolineaceae bacterium]|nr:YidC/Oxa1 family membrane protein insertase [Anaerolineaceae bacterium]
MWDLILNPFVTVITLLYSLLANNAVLAIVVFTILVRLAMYPLTAQQQRSSVAMQNVQPEMKKLQEKYKNDKEKLAQEQMKLYKEHGVNPLGGCLPLLIQFPIWIGLYQAINHALAATPLQLIDLSGRFLVTGLDHLVPLNNVFLGIDLTQPPTINPVYAMGLPVLVLATSWLQSKLMVPSTPSGNNKDGKPDQAQAMTQSMTTIMPLMMGFFSLSFSVGLSIYFVVSNVITIVQYSMMGKMDWKRVLSLGGGGGPAPAVIESKSAPPKAKPKSGKAK